MKYIIQIILYSALCVGTAHAQPKSVYFQPTQIRTPEGTQISLAFENSFAQAQESPTTAGLLVGAIYRLRITDIPSYPGKELYPSIEMIDRINPPQGQELRFPVIVDITQEDLELAIDGKFVTRVVYLEEPNKAIPALKGNLPLSHDVFGSVSPFSAAQSRGRPIAIVRIGGRTPDAIGAAEPAFFFGSPAWLGLGNKIEK